MSVRMFARTARLILVTVMSFLAVGISASQTATAAAPMEAGVFELRYKEGMQRVATAFDKSYGTYLGSGSGSISGQRNGDVVWDLYEDQSDPALHRTQFVGQITAPDGSKINFETTGYFIPRKAEQQFWDLTSAIHFSDAKGGAYRDLDGRIGLWEGHVQISEPNIFAHSYKLYVSKP